MNFTLRHSVMLTALRTRLQTAFAWRVKGLKRSIQKKLSRAVLPPFTWIDLLSCHFFSILRWCLAKQQGSKQLTASILGKIRVRLDVEDPYQARVYVGTFGLLRHVPLKDFLRPRDVVMDVGANIGLIAAAAAVLVGVEGEVHCFEPVGRYFERLKRMAEENPKYRIFTRHAALGETRGRGVIKVCGERDIGFNTLVPGYLEKGHPRPDRTIRERDEFEGTEEVAIITLDDYVEGERIEKLDFLKVDAEGYELLVLLGARKTLARFRPVVACEILDGYKNLGRTLQDYKDLLDSLGYRCFLRDTREEVDILSLDGKKADVVFLPKEHPGWKSR